MEAARRLERGLVWRRIGLRLQRAAAVAFLVGAGWLAHAQVGLFEITDSEASPKPPAFVEDARHAHETALIRARMVSQHERPDYDPAEIRAETGIAVPTLPADWRVVDAQVFPSRFGHSVELVLDADALGRVSLFAARSPSLRRDRAHPGAFRHGHHGLLAVGRTCLRAHRLRSRGSDPASCRPVSTQAFADPFHHLQP